MWHHGRENAWICQLRITSGIIPAVDRSVQEPRAVSATTTFGLDLTRDELVSLSFKSRTNGLYLIGKQGRGKAISS